MPFHEKKKLIYPQEKGNLSKEKFGEVLRGKGGVLLPAVGTSRQR